MSGNPNLKQAKLLVGNILQFLIWIVAIINLFVTKPPFFDKTSFPVSQSNLANADGWFKALFFLLFALYLFFIIIVYFYKDKKYKAYWIAAAVVFFLLSGFSLVKYNLLTDTFLVEYPKETGKYVLIGDKLQPGMADTLKKFQLTDNQDLVMSKGGKITEIWTEDSIKSVKYHCIFYYISASGFIFLFLIAGIQLLKTHSK